MAPAAGPLPFHFSIQTTSSDGRLTTIASSTDATVAYLDELVQGFQDAINNRILSATDPLWRHVSDRYQMGSKTPLYIDPAPDSFPWIAPTGIEENMKELVMTCDKYPEYHMEFLHRTTQVEEGRGRATTLCVLKVSGLPSGVLSEGLMAFDWKQITGTWQLLRTTYFRGPGGV